MEEEEEEQHVSDQPEGVVISDISEEGGPDAWPGDACGFLERSHNIGPPTFLYMMIIYKCFLVLSTT